MWACAGMQVCRLWARAAEGMQPSCAGGICSGRGQPPLERRVSAARSGRRLPDAPPTSMAEVQVIGKEGKRNRGRAGAAHSLLAGSAAAGKMFLWNEK